MIMTVYAEEPKVFSDSFLEVTNLVNIKVSDDVVFEWFEWFVEDKKSNPKRDYRKEFEKWLTEYTADDTVGLWDYAVFKRDNPRIAEILW